MSDTAVRRPWVVAGLYWAAFLLLQVLGRYFIVTRGVSIWYLPPALSVLLVLRLGPAWVPALLVGPLIRALISHPAGASWAPGILFALAHAGAYGLVGVLLRGFLGPAARVRDVRQLIALLLACLAGPLLLALPTTAVLLHWGIAAPGSGAATFRGLWLGDATGLFSLLPFLAVWAAPLAGGAWRRALEASWPAWAESLLQLALSLAVGPLVLSQRDGFHFPLVYLAFVPLGWIAFRRGLGGVALGVPAAALSVAVTFRTLGLPAYLLLGLQPFLLLAFGMVLLAGATVTERARQARASRRQAAHLRRLVEGSGAIPVEVDPATGRTLYVGPQAGELLGLAEEAWRRTPWWGQVLDSESQARFVRFCRDTAERRGEAAAEFVLATPSGPRAVRVLLGQGTEEEGRPVRGFLFDITAQRESEEALLRSEEEMASVLGALPDLLLRVDREGRVLEHRPPSHGGLRLADRNLEGEALGEALPELGPRILEALDRAQATGGMQAFEFEAHSRTGGPRYGEARVAPLPGGQGLALVRDQTERRRWEAHLESALEEKELLLKEIHHRVKNNLQVVSSLLRLQAAGASDPALQQALREAQNRIQAIAFIHQKLKQAPGSSTLDLQAYIPQLVQYLVQSVALAPSRIQVRTEVAPVLLGTDEAVPLGILLHEWVANALLHAFPEGRQGTLRVRLAEEGGELALEVEDDGPGLPEGVDPAGLVESRTKGLGFQLTRALADQLKGRVEWDAPPGTRLRLRFRPANPLPAPDERTDPDR